jgi:hypothetical protein
MKTIKLLVVLCFIVTFSTNNVKAQKETGTQILFWEFHPGRFPTPCVHEYISGYITEYQSFTNNTYHVRARGVLYGLLPSTEEYEISYEFNSCWPDPSTQSHFVFPILLKHDNKIVAVIHAAGRLVTNGNGEIVQNVYIERINCM